MFKKREYTFSDRVPSKQGILSTIVGIFCLFIFMVILGISIAAKGTLPLVIGFIGDTCMIVCLIGIGIAIDSYRNENTLNLFKNIGLVLNSLCLLIWIAVFLFGYWRG